MFTPIQRGNIVNFDEMEKIWHNLFYSQLQIEPAEKSLLISHSVSLPRSAIEKMGQILFETFNFSSICMKSNPTLSLFAQGVMSGLVLDMGETVTSSVAVYEGQLLSHTIQRLDIGGLDVSQYLAQLINEKNLLPNLIDPFDPIIKRIKEEELIVVEGFGEYSKSHTKKITLPDGKTIEIDSDLIYKPAEILFTPSFFPHLNHNEAEGASTMIQSTIVKCDVSIRHFFYDNIRLVGGNSMFRSIQPRVNRDIFAIAYRDPKIRILASPDRYISSWLGGSILGSLSTFSNMVVGKEEYDEVGPSLFRWKFVS